MWKRRLTIGPLLALAVAMAASVSSATADAEKPAFTVGWSVYAGWTPYHYMNRSGILRKWADKYGIEIDPGELLQFRRRVTGDDDHVSMGIPHLRPQEHLEPIRHGQRIIRDNRLVVVAHHGCNGGLAGPHGVYCVPVAS